MGDKWNLDPRCSIVSQWAGVGSNSQLSCWGYFSHLTIRFPGSLANGSYFYDADEGSLMASFVTSRRSLTLDAIRRYGT